MQNSFTLPFRPCTLRGLIDRMALERPDSVYLLSPESGLEWTYLELRRQSNRLGRKLIELGCCPGDKVAFMMDNGVFTAGVFLGTIYAGFVSVPLNVRAGRTQLAYMLDHSDARVVFVSPEYEELFKEVKAELGRDLKVIRADVDHGPGWDELTMSEVALPDVSPDAPALLIYTSGSTEQPKGALHTQGTFVVGGWNTAIPHELSSADRTLCVLPLYHINAESISLLGTLLTGGMVVMPHRFIVREFWDWLADHQCTWTAIVPTIVSQLLDWVNPRDEGKAGALERIRFIRSSSAPLAPALHQAFEDKFGLRLIEAMGSTECAGNIFSNPLPPGKDKIGTPGRPYGFELRLLDPEGKQVRQGQAGEIHLRGPSIMAGYYKNPQGTSAVLDCDGWLRTGDLAYRDEDGYVFIVGRAKELIIKGGMNVAPRQIDDVLLSHAAVQDAAALGVPDHYFGEDIIAFVVLRSGGKANEQNLREFCEKHLGSFKAPTEIHFVAELPKGPTGKVQRLRLGECFKEIIESYPRPTAANVSVDADGVAGSDTPLSAAGTAVEQIIAETWAEMFDTPQVGVHQNFFALGGHSLLAIEIVCQLRKQFSVGLSINDFFTKPTITQQAALVTERLARDSEPQQGTTPGSTDSVRVQVPARRADLEGMLLQRRNAVVDQAVISPRDRSSDCPLSPAQERLWFLEQLHPGMCAYNEGDAVRLHGRLDIGLLEQALNIVIDRHEVLRTLIRVVDGRPIQIVQDSWPISFERIDISSLPIEQRDAEVDRLVTHQLQQPFDLATTPGIRGTVARLDNYDHVFIMAIHHIVCDGWSMGIVYQELGSIYRALSRQEPHDLPAPPLQYGDYAAWQRQKVARNEFAKEASFWKKYLEGAPDTLDLSTNRARPGTFTYQGEKKIFSLGRDATERIRWFSRIEGVSVFMTLTAAFETLLYRYTGQNDVVLGVPFANRDRDELASLFGFLIDFHALRTDLSGNPSFRELLGRVRKGLLDIEQNRAIPFDKVVEVLQPRRDLSRAMLFQSLVVWKDRQVQMQFIELDGLTVSYLNAHAGGAKYDLTLYLSEAGDEIWLELEYCTDLFDEATIHRMVGHYQRLLEGIVADPAQPIGQLPLLTEDERHQLLVDWNDTRVDYPKDSLLHELFEAQARRVPDKVAVVCEHRAYTYSELNGRADQLAQQLRALGVNRDVLVGLFVERSLDMTVGLLGILKAGGAYLPMDPAYPTERLGFMLGDAQPSVIVTQQALAPILPPHAASVVCLDAPGWQTDAALRDSRRQGTGNGKLYRSPVSTSLAYVLFTSGSTGRPKGVEVPHRAVVNLLTSMRREPGLAADDTLLSVTTLSFDIAALELFLPLTTGACVVIASRDVATDGRRLVRLLDDCAATIMQATPATWRILLQAGWRGDPRLKVLCGGEALRRDLADRLLPRCAELWNLYGPTETTIWSAAGRVLPGEPIVIGRPIANTQFYVLDRQLQPVPIGVPGELFIGGDGLARGYFNRPELSAERFIANPLRAESGGRLYRTGDCVRLRPDGCLEFLGRFDNQVKIRGNRIELGEVESVLGQHPQVREQVVVARQDSSGEQRLVAYVVPRNGVAVTFGQVRDYLQSKLPAYMIPSALVILDALPLTANGKLDRRALPEPAGKGAVASSGYTAPSTEVEEKLALMWANVLGLERVGIHENFFELGGHSLMATHLFARIEAEFGRLLPLATFFRAQTVAEMAAVLLETPKNDPHPGILTLRTGDHRRPPLFLVHSHTGEHLNWRPLIECLGNDRAIHALTLPQVAGAPQPFLTIEALAAHHVEQICALAPHGPYHIAAYSFGATVASEIAVQLSARGREIGVLAAIDWAPAPRHLAPELSLAYWKSLVPNMYWFLIDHLIVAQPREIVDRTLKKLQWVAQRAGLVNASPPPSPLERVREFIETAKIPEPIKQVIEVQVQAGMNYQPQPFDGRVTLFRIRADSMFYPLRHDLGWSDVARGGVDIILMRGDHFSVMEAPRVKIIADHLEKCLADADDDHAVPEWSSAFDKIESGMMESPVVV
jgi:amino acid adenylation domain-containing protein